MELKLGENIEVTQELIDLVNASNRVSELEENNNKLNEDLKSANVTIAQEKAKNEQLFAVLTSKNGATETPTKINDLKF